MSEFTSEGFQATVKTDYDSRGLQNTADLTDEALDRKIQEYAGSLENASMGDERIARTQRNLTHYLFERDWRDGKYANGAHVEPADGEVTSFSQPEALTVPDNA